MENYYIILRNQFFMIMIPYIAEYRLYQLLQINFQNYGKYNTDQAL